MPEVEAARRRTSGRRPVLRVRTGCFTCRNRKKKCDEMRPVCTGCKRNMRPCQWPARGGEKNKLRHSPQAKPGMGISCRVDGRKTVRRPSREQERHAIKEWETQSHQSLRESDREEDNSLHVSRRDSSTTFSVSPTSTEHTQNEASPLPVSLIDASLVDLGTQLEGPLDFAPADVNFSDIDVEELPLQLEEAHDNPFGVSFGQDIFTRLFSASLSSVPRNPSAIPNASHDTFELMSYYLGRTASSMGNGSTGANPFIVQLVPLSFCNDLVRQLILSQSAAHRAVCDEGGDSTAVAHRYYVNSIRSFRKAINAYIDGSEPSPLWIAVGSLIMCFTETARGDTNGVVFDHLQAAEPLLIDLISNHRYMISDDLKTFIVEYYVYTATISMISASPAARAAPLLNPILQQEAHDQAASGYIGQLCGCWLQLLLLIPRIVEFGQRATVGSAEPLFPSPDDFIEFSALQSEILFFMPPDSVTEEVKLCGQIFQQAMHLYLLTAFATNSPKSGLQQMSIENSVSESFGYLDRLSATARINTSLCWALAVIGTCTTSEAQRDILRARLQLMFSMIGLGNIASTLALLEHIWLNPDQEQNPWAICRAMQDHETWISFA